MKPRHWLYITGAVGCVYITAEVLGMFGAPAMPSRLTYLILAAIVVAFIAAGSLVLADRQRGALESNFNQRLVDAAAYANRRHEGLVTRIEEMAAENARAMLDLARASADRLDEIEAEHGRQFGELGKLLDATAVRIDEWVVIATRRLDGLSTLLQQQQSIIERLAHPSSAEAEAEAQARYDEGYADGAAARPMRPLRNVNRPGN